MFKPEVPGDFGKILLNITKKLRTQNFWLKVTAGVLSVTSFVLYIRNLTKKERELSLPKEQPEEPPAS
ncbi:MAG TPA: hypothetical protein VI757_05805 [Bacteroidia bacterium]|nr:hypothetical protein [Bacteroidia bacterium]